MKGLGVVHLAVLEPYSTVFLWLDKLTRKIKLFKQGILLYATSKIGTYQPKQKKTTHHSYLQTSIGASVAFEG